MAENKKTYEWTSRAVPKNDLKYNQWPFCFTRRAEGEQNIDCRSMETLKNSFRYTPYTLKDADVNKVKNRYTLLFDLLNGEYREITPKMTHLMFCYDRIYFLLEGDSEVKSLSYATNICSDNEAKMLLNSILYKTRVIEDAIKIIDNKDEILRPLVEMYIHTRKQMAVLDDEDKCIIDILNSDILFTKLQYVFFMPYPSYSKDILEVVKDKFETRNSKSMPSLAFNQKYNVDSVNLRKKVLQSIDELPNLKKENDGFTNFIEKTLGAEDKLKNISYVYFINPDGSEKIDNNYVKNIFMNHTKEQYKSARKYVSIKEQKRARESENSVLRRANEILERDKAEILSIFLNIMELLKRMSWVAGEGTRLYNFGKNTNNAEFDVWMKYYHYEIISNYIDMIYNSYQKLQVTKDERYPICKILSIINRVYCNTDEKNSRVINNFNLIVPNYFKDDRLSDSGYGGNSIVLTVEEKSKLLEALTDIQKIIIALTEVFIGVQYATFGVFMGRFGYSDYNLDITLMFLQEILDKYKNQGRKFVFTENILEYANRGFFAVHYPSDFKLLYQKDKVSSYEILEERKKKLGNMEGFIHKYLNALSFEENAEKLERNNNMEISQQVKNLLSVFDCVLSIIQYYINIFGKEIIMQYSNK